MANGPLSSSRTALLFAGGVIVCTIIAASSLSADFAPRAERDGNDEAVSSSASAESDALAAKRRAEAAELSESEESVFGDYEGEDDDEDLIDDTMGVDTTPVEDEPWEIGSETAPDEDFETIIETPAGEGRLTPVAGKLGGRSGANPLQREVTPEDKKRQAAQLTKLRKNRKPN